MEPSKRQPKSRSCQKRLIALLSFFINQFGISTILEKPSIMGITLEQEQELTNLKELLFSLGDI